jgi:hypothetical protein
LDLNLFFYLTIFVYIFANIYQNSALLQHVMKFAEMSQEVQVTRIAPTPKRPDIAFTPGRRRANQVGSTLLMLTNLFYFRSYRFSERQLNALRMLESLKESLSPLTWALFTGMVLS